MRHLVHILAAFALLLIPALSAPSAGAGTSPTLSAYCTNSDFAYTVAFPADWFQNTRVEGDPPVQDVAACRFFSPSDFTVTPGAEPSGIAIGFFSQTGTMGAGEPTTVDGFPAVVGETGEPGDRTYLYDIQVTADTRLTVQTNENWAGDYAENVAIIDRQMEGIEIHPFGDIADSEFVWDIAELHDMDVVAGCRTTAYCPEADVTREQMASFIARAYSLPPTTTDYFSDDDDSVHEGAINRVAEAGITRGCTATTFCPHDDVTREQMASFLVRAENLSWTEIDHFVDDESSVHEGDINRLAESGITGGCAENRFCPDRAVSRGEMAAFIYRALTKT